MDKTRKPLEVDTIPKQPISKPNSNSPIVNKGRDASSPSREKHKTPKKMSPGLTCRWWPGSVDL